MSSKKILKELQPWIEITKLKIQKKAAAKERKAIKRATAAFPKTEDLKPINSDCPFSVLLK